MSLYVDIKYLSLLSNQLRNFKKQDDTRWNFSCPLCGDSKKSKTKARGFILRGKRGDGLYFFCHNCNEKFKFREFLEQINPVLYQEYVVENYKENQGNSRRQIDAPAPVAKPVFTATTETLDIPLVSDLPDGHKAKTYIEGRMLPEISKRLLYYTDDFGGWVSKNISRQRYNLSKNEPRIVIPFFGTDGSLQGAQGRSLLAGDVALRYITVKKDEDERLVYGLERWKPTLVKTYIVEGPIDSLFIPNCIASANADLAACAEHLMEKFETQKAKFVLVFDNENRNSNIVDNMLKAARMGMKVVVWSERVVAKDLNAMIQKGMEPSILLNTIANNTVSGLEALLRISQWQKVL